VMSSESHVNSDACLPPVGSYVIYRTLHLTHRLDGDKVFLFRRSVQGCRGPSLCRTATPSPLERQ
jgi:hypothetical protein